MEPIEKTAQEVIAALSEEELTQFQENTQDSENSWVAKCLGGWRNFNDYTVDKLERTHSMDAALKSLKGLKIAKDNVFIHGPVGAGKTHLAVVIARAHLKLGVMVVNPLEIFREIRSCSGASDEQRVIDKYSKCKVLVLDDFGAHKDTEFSTVALYEIISYRYANDLGGLIVTSNLSLDGISAKTKDDRISSRLAQMCHMIDLSQEKDHRI